MQHYKNTIFKTYMLCMQKSWLNISKHRTFFPAPAESQTGAYPFILSNGLFILSNVPCFSPTVLRNNTHSPTEGWKVINKMLLGEIKNTYVFNDKYVCFPNQILMYLALNTYVFFLRCNYSIYDSIILIKTLTTNQYETIHPYSCINNFDRSSFLPVFVR